MHNKNFQTIGGGRERGRGEGEREGGGRERAKEGGEGERGR